MSLTAEPDVNLVALDEQLGGHPDSKILGASTREARTLITFDLDFGDIHAHPPASHAGIWVLRPHRCGTCKHPRELFSFGPTYRSDGTTERVIRSSTVLVCTYDYHVGTKAMKTARMTILVTPEQKASINRRAKQLKLSAGEVIRRAVDSYSSTIEEEAALSALAYELEHSVKEARGALRDALSEGRRLRKEWAVRNGHKRRAA